MKDISTGDTRLRDAHIPPRPRIFSEAECRDIAQRVQRFVRGGGETMVSIVSRWTGNVRWARNLVSTSGEDRNDQLMIWRNILGFWGRVECNDVRDEALVAAVRQAERLALRSAGGSNRWEDELGTQPDSPFRDRDEPFTAPSLVFASTEQLNAKARALFAQGLAQSAAAAGMLSAGYAEVSSTSKAAIASWGLASYYEYTWAQCSITVRDPKGVGSGWAGVDWPDWNKIDGAKLAAIALDKCLQSRNPVAVEPGRYTTILEPQAVCDFMFDHLKGQFDRIYHETGGGPFNKSFGFARLGEKVMDERITISTDPMDPDLAFPPYHKYYGQMSHAEIYHPAIWIDHGIYKGSYDHEYAAVQLGRPTGLPDSGAYRMSGGDSSIAEMIATTKRGLLATRFAPVDGPSEGAALVCRGYTRDGLWLIEDGKISKPVKNMVFVESIYAAFNNVELLGPAQRVFHPKEEDMFTYVSLDPRPIFVPPLKIRDFSFTSLSDAI